MATLQVSRPDLETPLSSTLLTFTDISEMEINEKKVVAIICPQVSPGAYYPRCVSGSSSAFTQSGINASGSDAEINATVSSIYSEPTAHFVLTKTGISTYTLRSVGYNFYSPGYDVEGTNGLAWVEIPEEFTLTSPIISDTTGIAVNAMASNSSFIRFTEGTAGKILCAGADASEFGFSSADDITSVWYVYEINGYVAEDLFTVTVTSNNSTYGTLSGAGNYTGGSTATISVVPAAGYKFLSWTDGNINDEREIIVDDDLSFRANLAPASGLTYAIKENLVTMWTRIKSYFSGTSGASHIGVAANNAVGATTVADVVGSIGQASGIATLDSTGKLDSNQLPSGLLSGTVGSTTTPVYLDNGTITAVGSSLAVDITGSAAKVGVATVGSSSQPVYLNAGTPTACGTSLAVDITGNAATATTASACSGNAATATTASKLGSSTVGSSKQPIYLNAGTPTACGFSVQSVVSLPANPDPNTLYIVTGS